MTNRAPLAPREAEQLCEVFRRYPEVESVSIFGSRAKGTHSARSDVDLALWGDLDPLRAEAIASDLDDLPLPYRYDVFAFESIKLDALKEHIKRVGVPLYPTAAEENSRSSCDPAA